MNKQSTVIGWVATFVVSSLALTACSKILYEDTDVLLIHQCDAQGDCTKALAQMEQKCRSERKGSLIESERLKNNRVHGLCRPTQGKENQPGTPNTDNDN